MTLNVELLRETLAYVETHPEDHNQLFYRNVCDSTMCFAGWAATLAGGTWYEDEDLLIAESDDVELAWELEWRAPEGRRVMLITTHGRARRVLGLTGDEAAILFVRCQDLDDVRRCVYELLASTSASTAVAEVAPEPA